jgi:hypothetical protein
MPTIVDYDIQPDMGRMTSQLFRRGDAGQGLIFRGRRTSNPSPCSFVPIVSSTNDPLLSSLVASDRGRPQHVSRLNRFEKMGLVIEIDRAGVGQLRQQASKADQLDTTRNRATRSSRW